MPATASLKQRRRRSRELERQIEAELRDNRLDLKRLRAAIHEEKAEREHYEDRRAELRDQLEAEIELDAKGKGKKPERWEEWVDTRRDELADLIEASEARIDRLVLRAAEEAELIEELRDKEGDLEQRIDRLTKRIAAQKADRQGQLSRDFHVREFDCRDGTPVPEYMVAHLRQLCRRHLQPLRDAGGVVSITSGYRTAAYNQAIGGASQSYHVYTLRRSAPAVDHVQAGRTPREVQAWHDAHRAFDAMGIYDGFTHGDDRGYHVRWYGAG